MHPRYQDWLSYVFDHPVEEPAWHFSPNAPEFQASDEDSVELLAALFQRAGKDLLVYSDGQVNQGLHFLASPACSGFMFALRDSDVALPRRLEAIRSIFTLYQDCFATRCSQTLSHLDEPWASKQSPKEPRGSDLNPICYSFWCICPLTYLEQARDRQALEEAVFSVLARILRIPHRACQEGALMGLLEMVSACEDRVRQVVQDFLPEACLDPSLRRFGEQLL